MRKYLASLVFVGCAFTAWPGVASPSATAAATVEANPTVAVQRVPGPVRGLRDEAAMVLVGTALIGLAAAVRRAARCMSTRP